jgi:hypothetical protein
VGLDVGLTTIPCKKILRSLQEIQPFLMEEDIGGGQGLSWAVEPRIRRFGMDEKSVPNS